MSFHNYIRNILPVRFWIRLRLLYYKLVVFNARVKFMMVGKNISDFHNIPILINNYNRLEYLKILIDGLTKRGYNNIHIIDNNSTYPPLLEYYKTCPYDIIHLGKNVGYDAIWRTDVYERFKDSYYVYTDADLEIDEICPDNFMEYFLDVLKKHPSCQKVGFSLRIDDLPNHYKNKAKVIEVEKQFWINQNKEGLYCAKIDTTFALYRPFCKGAANGGYEVYRTPTPYLVRHLPWYIDSDNLSDEEKYYVNSGLIATEWSKLNQK